MLEITEELPPIATKLVAYEQEHGRRPNKQVFQIVVYFERLGMALVDLGRDDAKKGRKPLPFSVFYDLTKRVIVGGKDIADECTQIYAELMREDYMTGYDGKKEDKADGH